MGQRELRSLLWLIPPMIAGGMWGRSCQRLDEVSAVDQDYVLRALVLYRGAVHWVRAENNATPRTLAWDSYAVPEGATWRDFYPAGDEDVRWMGFAKYSTRRGPRTPVPAVMRWRSPVTPWLFTSPYKAYAVPYWMIVVLTAIPAARAVARLVRRSLRRRRGLCPGCGYDLRATTDRCPECSEPVAPA